LLSVYTRVYKYIHRYYSATPFRRPYIRADKKSLTNISTMNTNHVVLIGYVGNHLSAKRINGSITQVRIRMATHYQQKLDNGDKKYVTTWHDIVAWDSTAEYAEKSLVKGSRILVQGSIEYRTYPDKNGHTRYITQIKARSLMNLDR
jgi:single-strand DNA-binding protein